MDMINAQMGGADGVNPEGDGTGITFEYDSDNDKMIVDGGEYAVSVSTMSLSWVPRQTPLLF